MICVNSYCFNKCNTILSMHFSDTKPEVIEPSVEYVSVTSKGTATLDCKINEAKSYSWSKLDKCTDNSLNGGLFISILFGSQLTQ